MNSFKDNFISFNGERLLNLDINELISTESYQSEFIVNLTKLRSCQQFYDSTLIKFKNRSSALFETCRLLIANGDNYSWLLHAINNISPAISDIYKNLIYYIPSQYCDHFQQKLTQKMHEIVPIVAMHLKQRGNESDKSQSLLYFVLNAVSWCYNSRKHDNTNIKSCISAKCWRESKLLQNILNKFENAVNIEGDYFISCGLLMIIASLAAYSTLDQEFNDIFKDLDFSTVMFDFMQRFYCHLNDIQISFSFRTILYIQGSQNTEIEWIIENTNAINAILKEYKIALNKKCVNDVFNYYPDAWDRSISLNILCENEKCKQILIKKDVIYYLKKALRINQTTNVLTSRLYKNVCLILVKLTENPSDFKYFYKYFNPKRYIYYKGDKNRCFWNRLNWIRLNCLENIDCNESSEIVQVIFNNVHKYYYHLFHENCTLIHDDLINQIINFLW